MAVWISSTIPQIPYPTPSPNWMPILDMNDDSQIVVPDAFVALFQPPGDHRPRRPTEPREVIAARHELCEDMAQMLTETARHKLFELGVAESDVLERISRGLRAEGSPVSPAEAGWVTGRLAELLAWPLPGFSDIAEAEERGLPHDAKD